MKNFNLVLLALIISSSSLSAEEIDKSWEIGIFGDYIKSSTAKESLQDWQQIEAGKSLGLDLHKIINERWNIRLELAASRYEIGNGTNTDSGSRVGLDAIYKFENTGLYAFVGGKRFNNTKSYNAINLGAGYNFQINERWSAYSEGAIYKDVNYGYNDKGLKLGLKYAFGDVKKPQFSSKKNEQPLVENKPVVAPAVVIAKKVIVDSDNDGISDEYDKCSNTPAMVKVDADGCVAFTGENVEVKLNVSFATNSAVVQPTRVNDIERLAIFMKKYTDTSVTIEGHSSAVGSAQYNLTLSQKRANAVKGVLVNDYSIDATRITAQGFGQTQLLSTGNTKADHQLNRRVVAKIEATTKE